MKTRLLFTLATAALAMVVAAGALAQSTGPKLYKWVDQQGVVHYGSSVPPQYADQKLEVLNSQGVTVKTVEAAKTPEQLAKEKTQKKVSAQETEQQQKQRTTDQMLLDTYTSVGDIEQDRNTRRKAMDAQIGVTNNAIASLESSLKGYRQEQATLGRKHQPIPVSLKKDLASTEQQLDADHKLLGTQLQQRQAMEELFNAYVKRFKELAKDRGNGGD
ncbi:MAG: DUF4124 domain-containing protein [Gammaproteobacteria bacterium]